MAFDHSRRRWFGTCFCKPVPRGLPSSVKQLRTSSAFRPFAVLVAHYNRVTVDLNFCVLGQVQRSPHRGLGYIVQLLTCENGFFRYEPKEKIATPTGSRDE